MKLANKTSIFSLLLILLLCDAQAVAQSKEQQKELPPWYVGLKGGVPFGVSAFSSFGSNKIPVGYNCGVLVGRNFSDFFSIEISATYGKMDLNSDSYYGDYWLGVNGTRYVAPVTGQTGAYYRDLYSTVTMQQLGMHLNIDLIALFNDNTHRKVSVLISPSIYGVSTQATLNKVADNTQFIKKKRQLQLGFGGSVALGYDLTRNLALRLSSGFNQILGGSYDGIPVDNRKYNFIWNNHLALTWRFGKRDKKRPSPRPMPTPIPQPIPTPEPTPPPISDTISDPQPHEETIKFPSIYFELNSVEVDSSQMEAIDEIARLMNEDPKIKIILAGFTDYSGSIDANDWCGVRRSISILELLIKEGIHASRIDIVKGGMDLNEPSEARRVEVKQNK